MSPENHKSSTATATSRFIGVGRYLNDDLWLGEFQTKFKDMTESYGFEYHFEEIPAVVYATSREVKSSFNKTRDLPMLEGIVGATALIAELIDTEIIDGQLARSGLTFKVGQLASEPIRSKDHWDPDVDFRDIRVGVEDFPTSRGPTGAVINNERFAVRRILGLQRKSRIELRLGTIDYSQGSRWFGELEQIELHESLSKRFTLGPLRKLNK